MIDPHIIFDFIINKLNVNKNYPFPKIIIGQREITIPPSDILTCPTGEYNFKTKTIYLPHTWTGKNIYECGALAHQLVHYIQDMDNRGIKSKDREKEAYWYEEQFIKHFFDKKKSWYDMFRALSSYAVWSG